MDILWICALSRISLDYFGVREISVGVEQMDHFNEMNASCGRKCLLSAVARGHIYRTHLSTSLSVGANPNIPAVHWH